MSKESLTKLEEAFNEFIFSSDYNEQVPGYSGFVAGATWFKNQVLEYINEEMKSYPVYDIKYDELEELYMNINKL